MLKTPDRTDLKGFVQLIRRRDWHLIKRFIKHWVQYFTRGFSDDEIWNLDYTIAQLVLPRLKRFKEIGCGYPGLLTPEDWDVMLDKMIFAFEWRDNEDFDFFDSEENICKAQEGMKLFGEYFFHLWS